MGPQFKVNSTSPPGKLNPQDVEVTLTGSKTKSHVTGNELTTLWPHGKA
jgi:hypothetical protein